MVSFFGEGEQLLDRVEFAFVGEMLGDPVHAGVVGSRRVLAVAAGEQAHGKRAPHQNAQAVAVADGQDLPLDGAVEDGVGRLLGTRAVQPAPLGHPLGFDDFRSRQIRGADRPDLPGPHEVGERGEGLLDIGVRVGVVDLVKVDVVGPQPLQRSLDRLDDPTPGTAAAVGALAHRSVELGRQHDLVAASLECLSDDLLGLAVAVHIGGVDEVDALVQRPVDHAHAVVVIRIAHLAEHHGAQAVGTDLDAGPSQSPHPHGDALLLASM